VAVEVAEAEVRRHRQPPAATPTTPVAEWERYYSLNVMDANARPVLLTTTDGMIENQTSIAPAPDGKTFYYCHSNAKDIERRHIWAVPVAGGHAGFRSLPAPWNVPRTGRQRQVPRHHHGRLESAAIHRHLDPDHGRQRRQAKARLPNLPGQVPDGSST